MNQQDISQEYVKNMFRILVDQSAQFTDVYGSKYNQDHSHEQLMLALLQGIYGKMLYYSDFNKDAARTALFVKLTDALDCSEELLNTADFKNFADKLIEEQKNETSS